MELLAPKAYEKGIDIAWAIDPALPRALLGDEVRLRQIVTNLVGNAIKFTDTGGVLVTVGRARAEHSGRGPETTWRSPSRSRTPASASRPDALPSCSTSSSRPKPPCAAARAERAWGSPSRAAWRGPWPATSSLRASPARARRSRRSLRLKRAGSPGGRRLRRRCRRAAGTCCWRWTGRSSAARCGLALEGAGIPVEDGAVAGAGDLIDAAARAGEPFTTILVDGAQRPRGGAKLLARRPGGGARPQRAGRRRAGYGGQGGFPSCRVRGSTPISCARCARDPCSPASGAASPRAASPRPPSTPRRARAAHGPGRSRCCWSRTTTSMPCWRGACSRRSAAR